MWKIFIEYYDKSKLTLTGKHKDIPVELASKYYIEYVKSCVCNAIYQQYPKKDHEPMPLATKIMELQKGKVATGEEPLTLRELQQMAGRPVWCPEAESYGIIKCDDIGHWAGQPFLRGSWYGEKHGCGADFEYDIQKRKLKCYSVGEEKEIAKPLKQKTDAFGDTTMVCPNCESAAVINPYRKGRELYPHCPWCGQKLKEAEDETEKENQQAE